MGTLSTYWHLADLGRPPTDYEIATSRLLYHVGRGFEVAVPLADWYRRHQAGSALRGDDWERFHDPRETTYAAYVAGRAASEEALDRGAPPALAADWVAALAQLLPPALYLFHGLQMVSAYVGQMAPSGRLTIAAALQAADEMRAVERLARRTAALRSVEPGLGGDGKSRWQTDPAWQPARRLIETMLVTYDWGEAFAAVNLCAKPALDAFFWQQLRELAQGRGDLRLGAALASLAEDAAWHRAWSEALVAVAFQADPANRDTLADWVAKWNRPVREAVRALGPLAGPAGGAAAEAAVEQASTWQRRLEVGR